MAEQQNNGGAFEYQWHGPVVETTGENAGLSVSRMYDEQGRLLAVRREPLEPSPVLRFSYGPLPAQPTTPCPDCKGTGGVALLTSSRPCPTCGGSGGI